MTATLLMLTMTAAPMELPKDWHGSWAGTLVIGEQKVPMSLVIETIKESKNYRWQITYGDGDKKSVRNYELVPKEKSFTLDEKNGIELDMKLLGGVIYSQFDVGQGILSARYELRDKALHYEITTTGEATETGGKVKVYAVRTVQSAVLKK